MSLLTQKEVGEYLSVVDKVPAAQRKKILQLLELDRIERCRESYLFFVQQMWPVFISGKHHKIMADAFERVARGELKRLIINMPPRHRLSLDTPIPTRDGWKTIENVEVGDYVFSPAGNPVLVTGKSGVYEERIYEVETSDGQVIECDGEHLWTVRFGSGRPYVTLSTKEIYEKLETESWRACNNLPMLPPQKAAKYPYKSLPVDPYVLGVWLGDGSSHDGSVGCSFADMEQMRVQVEERGYQTTFNPKYQKFNVLGLMPVLRQMGLLQNKHIPEEYLCASVEQRIALLQGLIDTDGDVTQEGKVTFNQTDRRLIEQVLCLVHSLGVKARITERQTSYKGVLSQKSYRLMFKMGNAARLPRKANRCRDKIGNWSRSIDIRLTEKVGRVQCLEVENEDGLFMAGRGWVVTHNTKSEFASYLLPAWFLGKFPEKKIIQTAHTAELAVGFGRKVRNLVQSDPYKKVFSTELSSDSKAAGRWNTKQGGDYFAIGVGGAVTGKGADILIIDDPHSEQEAKQNNPAVYDNVYEWYTSGPRQRLQPGGAIIIVMCMTGDTQVLMSDGTQKYLKDIRPGDFVATYENGELTTSTVNNWQSNGVDDIYQVKTQSGIIFKANERHPFLVEFQGERQWIRLKNLKPGMLLVAMKDVLDPQDRSLSQDCVQRVKQRLHIIENTLTPHLNQPGITGNGKESYANNANCNRCTAKEFALRAIENNTNRRPQLLNTGERKESNTDTASRQKNLCAWLTSGITAVTSAANRLRRAIQERIGITNSVSTIATKPALSEVCYAMTATLPSDTEKPQTYCAKPLNTYSAITDQIVSIEYAGREEVFDVEIDRTENFIANGVVSHNTRWAKRDLTGQILKNSSKDGTDDWEVIEFPAILPSGTPLWPGFWKKEELEAIRAEIPVAKWEAQYQQNPTSEEGAIVKREQWRLWEDEDPPECEYVIQSWDTAFEKSNRADYSACTTWGVFQKENEKGIYQPNIILLDAVKDRLEFPELKKKAFELWKEWNPDTLIIEKRAAGAPLVYELRRMGIPLSEYTPYKGQDKIARVNSIADLFASGVVWRPDRRWAEEVVEEMASFPNGDHDDLVDSTSQALMRFRQGGFITIQTDEQDEPSYFKRKLEYY